MSGREPYQAYLFPEVVRFQHLKHRGRSEGLTDKDPLRILSSGGELLSIVVDGKVSASD
jgi:hypothetical protein